VDFNGVDQYLLLPTITNLRSISLWLYLPLAPTPSRRRLAQTQLVYMLDGRSGHPEAYFSSVHSAFWEKLLVDGVSVAVRSSPSSAPPSRIAAPELAG
jgi:hypothetical protein